MTTIYRLRGLTAALLLMFAALATADDDRGTAE